MLDTAMDENTHFGEFQATPLKMNAQQVKELDAGRHEIRELAG